MTQISLHQSDMAEMTKKYLKKLYYRERFEVINKGISTITAIWIICFLDYSKTITCLLVLATIVTNVLLYGYSSTDTIRNWLFSMSRLKRCFRLIILLGFRPHFQVTSKMPNRYGGDRWHYRIKTYLVFIVNYKLYFKCNFRWNYFLPILFIEIRPCLGWCANCLDHQNFQVIILDF